MAAMTEETADDRMKRLVTAQFKKQLPRKFYTSVEVSDQHGILLDGRTVKSPLKAALVMPNRGLAEAVAAEWRAQDKVIDPETMPLTKLANTALDRATVERAHVLDEVVQYAGADLVCYWADRPPQLVDLQRKHWQPVLDWAARDIPACFKHTTSMTHVAQDEVTLSAVRMRAAACDAWQLTGLYLLMTLTGSVLLSMMLQAEAADADAVWAAAHVDEDYQISQWGEDFEAAERRKGRRAEFDGLVRYLGLLEAN
jgi:chaperone required for assembly of F1-ATPase